MALRRFRLVAAAALVLAVGFSGCAGQDGQADDEDDPSSATVRKGDPNGPPDALTRPTWALRDAWTYTFNGAAATYVVTADQGPDWFMETDSEERAFADLRDDVSRLGPQRKSDLAGSQGPDRVEFFRWPLESGKTWTTTWDQQPLTIEVTGIGFDVARLVARDGNGTDVYRYSYDAKAGWFGELRRFAPDGTERANLQLTAAVHNWTGTVVRWTVATVAEDSGPVGSDPPLVGGPFEVAAGTTDIWAEYHFTCTGNGGYSVLVEPLNPGLAGQQGMNDGGPCVQVDWEDVIVPGPHPGTWAFALAAGAETIAYDYTLLLRTRQDVPIGAP